MYKRQFQVREANNGFYDALPAIVEEYMEKISGITGREYHLFNYYGAPDAEEVIVAMGSVSGTVEEAVDYLNARGKMCIRDRPTKTCRGMLSTMLG